MPELPRALVRALLVSALLLAACTGAEPPPPEAPPAPPPAVAPLPPLSAEARAGADRGALVPSPRETQLALERAGIAQTLAARVQPRAAVAEGGAVDPDRVAVRTGVVLADLLLTAGTAQPPAVVQQLEQVRLGLAQLGAGPDLLGVLERLRAEVENGTLVGQALVIELDELSASRLPALEQQVGARALPLIRAGSWLEGAYLVSGALIDAGRYDAATGLLRHPQVVDHFQELSASTPAPGELAPQLEATLAVLDRTSALPTLGEAEVREIHESTRALLALL